MSTAQATISDIVTTRLRTKGATPIKPDPDSYPLEEPLIFKQNDNKIRGLQTTQSQKSYNKTRAKAQKQHPKVQGIPEVDKRQLSSDKRDLSLEVQATEKRKSSQRKLKGNTKSILMPPEYHNQSEDPRNSDDDSALILSDINKEDNPRNPQRRKKLERNQVVARKCRARKRVEETVLASREQAVEDQNRYLSNTYDSLAAEVYFLKSELLRHTNCNCTLIQEYIANEAKKIVEKTCCSPSNSQASYSHGPPSDTSNKTMQTGYINTDYGGLDNQTPLEAHAIKCSITQFSDYSGVLNTTTTFESAENRRETFPLDHWSAPIYKTMHTDSPWQFEANYHPDLSAKDTDMAGHSEPNIASTSFVP
jgi:hypothetical protein